VRDCLSIETLLKRNLHEVFGERNANRRREAIAQLWTDDCVFIDHNGKNTDAMNSIVHRALISGFPTTFSVSFGPVEHSTKAAIGLELWTAGPRAYQGRRLFWCEMSISLMRRSLMRCRRDSDSPPEATP